MSRVFVDVGVRRIGEYITRVPKLKQIRGASAMISAATDYDDVLSALREQGFTDVTPNPDVGEAEGVVHLEITGNSKPHDVAIAVLTHVRRHLPGADLGGSWGAGEHYSAAFADIRGMSDRGEGLEWLPATSEAAWLQPCSACGSRPAAGSGGRDGLCVDCGERDRAARHSKRELATRLGKNLRFPGNELSDLIDRSLSDGPAGNHIALLCADGNGVGSLFEGLVGNPQVSKEERGTISVALAEATLEAVKFACTRITPEGEATRMIPILAAADDLSLFVAADLAWDFTLALLQSYGDIAQRKIVETVGDEVAATLPPVSMSAGLTFAKVKFPAADMFHIADALMRHAKQQQGGKHAAVSWLDVTANGFPVGGNPARGRPVVTVKHLCEVVEPVRRLAEVEPSGRKRMQSILRDTHELGIDSQDAEEYLRRQSQRVGAESAVAPFLVAGAPLSLETALDLVRWWL